MICTNCGCDIKEESLFCDMCGNAIQGTQKCYSNDNEIDNPYFGKLLADNRKVYAIMAYIGIFWLLGVISRPEKFDPRVRFNVGQGMILTIFSVCGFFVISVINLIISVFTMNLYVVGIKTNSIIASVVFFADIIQSFLHFGFLGLTLVLAIISIVNVAKNKDKPIPGIGRFSLYR